MLYCVAIRGNDVALWGDGMQGQRCFECSLEEMHLLSHFMPVDMSYVVGVGDFLPDICDAGLMLSRHLYVVLTDKYSLVYLNGNDFRYKTLRLSDYARGGIFDNAIDNIWHVDLVLDSKVGDFGISAFKNRYDSIEGTSIILKGVSDNIKKLALSIQKNSSYCTVRCIDR